MSAPLVLSLFPGIGLLDMAFEQEGFCVMRGPDLLWGGDIRRFHPPAGKFAGVIGGPPCQAFGHLGAVNRSRWGAASILPNLIPEFERCVQEAEPVWFLMENVLSAPLPCALGYQIATRILENRWLGETPQRRQRRFSFGIATHAYGDFHIDVPALASTDEERTVTSTGPGKNGRSLAEMAELQGLPNDFFDDAPFTAYAKQKMLANGVPLPMGRAVARAVKRALGIEVPG